MPRILVVDDAADVREYFMNLAQSAGFHCVVAVDGFQACRLISESKEKPFNLIFSDWKMPGMDGLQLAQLIKESFNLSSVVIMISGAEWAMVAEKAKAANVDGYLPKPLFASQIIDCIQTHLCSSQALSLLTEKEEDRGNDFAGKRILLVDDVEINREIILSLLDDTGIEIDSADNGRVAIEMFCSAPERYDLILMDIHMPEVDGYEATKRIRQFDHSNAQSIPIVAMTANVFREDIEQCLAAGMRDHIGKPISLNELNAKLKHYLLDADTMAL